MFDVFDILVPEILTTPRFEVRRQMTAFGPAEESYAYVDGIRFAEVLPARTIYGSVKSRTGSNSDWKVLLVADAGNAAAGNDGMWIQFLDDLRLILSAHPAWLVICESDCDQHPLADLELSAEGVTRLLDEYRRTVSPHLSFQATWGEFS